MIRVTVPSDKPEREYQFKDKWYGEQTAAIHTGGHYPLPFTVNSPKGEYYPKGEYTLDPVSFGTNDRGQLALKRIKLLPTSGASK
jgi:hypothetical protein